MPLFKKSAPKAPKGPTTGDAIRSLQDMEEMLEKKQKFLESKVESETQTARKNAKTNKKVALQALKRKKRYERQLLQIDGTVTTIEAQREALEGANTNTAVIKNMGMAAKALKKAHSNINVDNVHDIIDDIAEQQDVAREISDAISNPMGLNSEWDEDELEAELDELENELEEEEQEALNMDLLRINSMQSQDPQLPDVPVASPRAKGRLALKSDEDDFEDLAEWAS